MAEFKYVPSVPRPDEDVHPPIPPGTYVLRLTAEEVMYLWALSYHGEGGAWFPTTGRLTRVLEAMFGDLGLTPGNAYAWLTRRGKTGKRFSGLGHGIIEERT